MGVFLGLEIEYNSSLFKSSTIERLFNHYQVLLKNIVSDIKRPIGAISIVTESEKHTLLEEFNSTKVPYPKGKTLVDLFSAQVLETPDSIAVVYSDESLSYLELDKRSNQLAHYLREQGVKPDDLIGLCLRRGLDMVVGILGILKSGGAYVPIDPDYPQDRIDYIVEDTGIELLLTSGEGCFVKEGVSLLDLDSDRELLSSYSSGDLERVLKPDHLAYVIYTSGSTGKPKGVMVEHKNIIKLVKNEPNIAICNEDKVLQWSNYAFDGFIYEFFGSLLNGAQLYLIDKHVSHNAEELKDFLNKKEITVCFLTTALFNNIIDTNPKGFPSIKKMLFGGEAASVARVLNGKSHINKGQLFNIYGPTETVVYATTYEIINQELKNIPIGKPLNDTLTYVTNSYMSLQPIGVVGELCIGGAGVARGYLNKKELTKEKFIANPFKNEGRLYRTGDLVKWLPDGNIEFIGRKDNQVKIRGYRVELGEIEEALSKAPLVEKCCVIAKEDDLGNKYLVGYIVLKGDFNKNSIENYLKLTLPEYMIPRFWTKLDSLPINSNGKFDRKALYNLEYNHLPLKEYVAPRNEIEKQLCDIWQELLGIDRIGIHDNFFELGGHSLMVSRLVTTINDKLNANINIATIFKEPLISELAKNCNTFSGFKEDIIIPLNETNNSKTIYLAPPVSGTINCYTELAKTVGKDHSLYAFQCPGLSGISSTVKSVEELASVFITEMQKIDSKGPYSIGGYSFGGIVAYEMALQLNDRGYIVEELIFFDSLPLFTINRKLNRDKIFKNIVKNGIEDLLEKSFDWSILSIENRSEKEQIDIIFDYIKDQGFNIKKPDLIAFLEVNINNELAAYNYQPKTHAKLNTVIVLFKAMLNSNKLEVNDLEISKILEKHEYGWSHYTNKKIVVHEVNSNHNNILEKQNIKEISKEIMNRKLMSNDA
ncbi:putative Phenylalanine racemase (ATP-hydrolyzing) [Tenacibaculum xiamenense]